MGQGFGQLRLGTAGGKGAHINPAGFNGVHADTVTQKSTPGFPPGGITGNNGDVNIGKIPEDANNQFIGERGFSRSARTGEADDRSIGSGGHFPDPGHDGFQLGFVFCAGFLDG